MRRGDRVREGEREREKVGRRQGGRSVRRRRRQAEGPEGKIS